MTKSQLRFTLTPRELDQVLRFGLGHIGLDALATVIGLLDFDVLSVYALSPSETDNIQFSYTKRVRPTVSQGDPR